MDESTEKLLREDEVEFESSDPGDGKEKKNKFSLALMVTFILSLATNFIFLLRSYSSPCIGEVSRSKYAGLLNNVEVPYAWDTGRSSPNDTERNKLWYQDEGSDEGIMAIDNEEAEDFGLQRSQSWPWDKQKSIYITNGHHNMHCLRNIYISLNEYSQGAPQSLERQHILHCLGALYDDIKCNADDTPRFTHKVGLRPGEGQVRKCRDWEQLKRWAKERNGCFKYIKPGAKDISTIERMKYCNNGSKYLPEIRKYFGYGEDWMPWPYVEQDQYLKKGEVD